MMVTDKLWFNGSCLSHLLRYGAEAASTIGVLGDWMVAEEALPERSRGASRYVQGPIPQADAEPRSPAKRGERARPTPGGYPCRSSSHWTCRRRPARSISTV